MAKIIGVLVCLALVQTGYALQCYNCVSMPGSTMCDEFTDKISVSVCGKTAGPSLQAACIKKVTEDKNSKQMNTTRACIITKANSNNQDDCKSGSDRLSVVSCDVCTDDLCNSSTNIELNFLAIVSTSVFVLFSRYLL